MVILMDAKPLVILINYGRWNDACDVAAQTCYSLIDHGFRVLCIQYAAAIPFRRWFIPFLTGRLEFPIRSDRHGILHSYPLLLPLSGRQSLLFACSQMLHILFLHCYCFLRFRPRTRIAWFLYPQVSFLAPLFGGLYRIVYDMVDYFTSPEPKEAAELEQKKQELLDRSDIVVANSHVLKRLYARRSRQNITVVPMGFRLASFTSSHGRNIGISRTGYPVLGFVGGLNQRIDWQLMESLAKRNPTWLFVFVGPQDEDDNVTGFDVRSVIGRLRRLENVAILPRQPAGAIPGIISRFTVGMIPYDTRQSFNRYSFPMKLFEYFYLGKPVMATPIDELKRYRKYVMIGSSVRDWELSIKHLLTSPVPNSSRREMRRMALGHSWDRKIESILMVLSKQ